MSRPVSESDKRDLESALVEMLHLIIPILNVNVMKQNVSQDYRKQLITDLMERSHTTFTVTNIIERLPLFSITHALKILEVFQEIFEDITNLDAMVEVFGREELELPKLSILLQQYNFGEDDMDSSWEVEDDFI